MPRAGAVGTQVLLGGTNFSAVLSDNHVTFAGAASEAVVTAATATSLSVLVPSGAADGAISIKVKNSAVASSTISFDVATLSSPVAIGTTPRDLVVDAAAGYLWIANANGSVSRVQISNNSVNNYALAMTNPKGLAIDASGTLRVAEDGGAHRVLQVLADGSASATLVASDENPIDVAAHANDLWVAYADATPALVKFDSDGTRTRHALAAAPGALAIEPDGDMWVTLPASNSLYRIDAALSSPSTIPVGTAPLGVAIAPNGGIWVANSGSANVTRLDPNGNVLSTVTVGGQPTRIAIDASGHAWITVRDEDKVVRLDGNGTLHGIYLVGDSPWGIGIDGNGHVWVTNSAANTLSKIVP